MGSSLAQSGDAFRVEWARMEQNDKRVRVSERTLFLDRSSASNYSTLLTRARLWLNRRELALGSALNIHFNSRLKHRNHLN